MLIRFIKFFSFIFLLIGFINAKDIYQSIRIFDPSLDKINLIANVGIPLDHISGKPGVYIDLTASEDQVIELLSENIEVEILISDLTQYYQSNNIPETTREFPLGSMQGNYTWDELNERFDVLYEQYSEIISDKIIIGQSLEGRDIWAFKISDNPNENEEEP